MPEIPVGGTQKSDVYSFGVITQEIMYREGVFYVKDVDLDPEGTWCGIHSQKHDYSEEIMKLKQELTFNNCYVACVTFTLHQTTDPSSR